jgi:hypothetical protein
LTTAIRRVATLFVMALIVFWGLTVSAYAATILTIQAEKMSLDASSHDLITDSDATPTTSADNAVWFISDSGLATKAVNTSEATSAIRVIAKAGSTGGVVSFQLVVDGANYGQPVPVDAATYTQFTVDGPDLAAGLHTIGIKSVNTGAGHILKVDKLTLQDGGTVQPPPDPDPPTNTWDWTPSAADVVVRPGDDIDAKLNAAPAGAYVAVYSDADGEYTYTASTEIRPASNVKLHAQPGTFETVGGKAVKPNPAVHIAVTHRGDNGMRGWPGMVVRGFDLSGVNPSFTDTGSGSCSGIGSFIAGGGGDANSLYEYNRIHDNGSVGISNVEGRVLRNEFFNNTTNLEFLGCNAGGVKGSVEFEAGFNYVHNEDGNGIWCDNGCENEPLRGANGAWLHDNVIVDIGSGGIRAEELPDVNPDLPNPQDIDVTIEDNIIGGASQLTGRADIHVQDSSNVTVQDNQVGVRDVAGHGAVPAPGNGVGIRASDSCRSDRPNTGDPKYGPVRIISNDVNGTVLKVEEARYKAGDIILTGNTEVGTVHQEGGAEGWVVSAPIVVQIVLLAITIGAFAFMLSSLWATLRVTFVGVPESAPEETQAEESPDLRS